MVQVIQGELTDSELIATSINSCDVVFSALGPTGRNIEPGSLCNAYRNVFAAMRSSSIKRIFLMGTPSIVTPEDKQPLSVRLSVGGLRLVMNAVWQEVVAIGKLLDEEAQDLHWTMYRVGWLKNEDGVTRAAKFVGEGDWNLSTFRPGIVKWNLDQIEKGVSEWVREKPALYSISST